MTNRAHKVLIALPTYNEKQTIEEVIRSIFGCNFAKLRLKILVIDDNSPDGTAIVVQNLQKEFADLHFIKGPKNGLGEAYKRGFDYALSNFVFDYLVMMDADMSHDPNDIPRLIESINRGNDVVIGSRYISGGMIPGDWPLKRILNTKVAHFVARFVGGIETDTKELTGGFKAIRRAALLKIPYQQAKASGFGFQLFLSNQFITQGFKVSEVPICFRERKAGQSKMRVIDITEFILIALRLNPTSPFKRILATGLLIILNLLIFILLDSYSAVLALVCMAAMTGSGLYCAKRNGIFGRGSEIINLEIPKIKSSGQRIIERLF